MKLCKVYRDSRAQRIVRIARILLAIEDVLEELPEDIDVESVYLDPETVLSDHVKLVVSSDRHGSETRDLGFAQIVIELVQHPVSGNIHRFYDGVAMEFGRYSSRVLSPYLSKPVEYALLLLDSEDCIVMEGFEKGVVYPSRNNILFTAHTHPQGLSTLSRRDILTLLDILSKRGFAFCAMGVDGVLCVYRRLLVYEEDYEKLLAIANDVGYLDMEIAARLGLTSVGIVKI
ncbi:MAG TPA: hypothetical protein EYH02_06330 [Ignisphaera aggregans]|uniref:Uncharacterized protein n=1 Tax=Ignisphaera aggregans TaxID=334771 RepID=A0A832YZY6_9CREN|nr:hypothetical protein [Ignisphaera aggregans]